MPSNKRVRAALIVTFGVIMTVATFAAPANADNGYASPITGTKVLGVTASAGAPLQVAGVTASAPLRVAGVTASAPLQVAGVTASSPTSGLAFTGTNAIGIGALGGLLLVGGGAMVFAGRRRKIKA